MYVTVVEQQRTAVETIQLQQVETIQQGQEVISFVERESLGIEPSKTRATRKPKKPKKPRERKNGKTKDETDEEKAESRDQEKRETKSTIQKVVNAIKIKKPKYVERPPLKKLIKDTKEGIIGDVRPLLDFAILGHAKCATSFVMKWLYDHPEVKTWDYEVCYLSDYRPAALVKKLYEDLPKGVYKRGFKCPGHFSRKYIRYFRRYFSRANLIVGLRHPVRWFESFYNFRHRHPLQKGMTLPDPIELIGACQGKGQGLCTDRAAFHGNLAIFGRTNMSDPRQQSLLRLREKYELISPVENPIFLYDTSQLYDQNKTRADQFKVDLQHFLDLQAPMPPPRNASTSSRPKETAVDICEERYKPVRKELLKIGDRAATWILDYFLDAPDVVVSNRPFFEEMVRSWRIDPCYKAKYEAATPSLMARP
jgi:hypothetical protein